MRSHRSFSCIAVATAVALAAAALMLSGCGRGQAAYKPAPPQPPRVAVARVISRTVTNSETFTGTFQAVDHVSVRPRVSGYISSVDFADGSEVHKGQVLFVIDPRPYEAVYRRAVAQLDQVRSALTLARSEHARAVKLFAARAVSQEELDTRTANARQAAADAEAAKAAVYAAALNLRFTRVTAPISGRVSRAIVTAGNLVTSGQTLLTTIVSMDPIYVAFDVNERAYLQFEKHAGSHETDNRVYVGLEDETGYPHEARLVFMDNTLDPSTGTIRARALLANPGNRFAPGLFARVKLMGNDRYDAVLIDDSAIGTDQAQRYVLVVGPNNVVEDRPVELGPMEDGLRVIRNGLHPGDTVVVDGLQHVRPGARVSPVLVAMGVRRTHSEAMIAQNAQAAGDTRIDGPRAPRGGGRRGDGR